MHAPSFADRESGRSQPFRSAMERPPPPPGVFALVVTEGPTFIGVEQQLDTTVRYNKLVFYFTRPFMTNKAIY